MCIPDSDRRNGDGRLASRHLVAAWLYDSGLGAYDVTDNYISSSRMLRRREGIDVHANETSSHQDRSCFTLSHNSLDVTSKA